MCEFAIIGDAVSDVGFLASDLIESPLYSTPLERILSALACMGAPCAFPPSASPVARTAYRCSNVAGRARQHDAAR